MSHTDDDSEVAEDAAGGDDGIDFEFEVQESEVNASFLRRLKTFWKEFIYKPGLVAWSDWRTRIGLFIMAIYVMIATYGVNTYPDPDEWTNILKNDRLEPAFNASAPVLETPVYQAENGTWIVQSFVNASTNPLGTTTGQKDVLGMIVHGTPEMLIMVVSGGVFATAVALILGTTAGYKGGRVDRVLMTISDIAMSIPGLPLVIVALAIFEPDDPVVIGMFITINYWAGLGRSIRSQVLSIRENSYVEASRVMGISTGRILFKDIIPNLMPFVLVNFVNAARYVVFASVGLYFIGVLSATGNNWGVILKNAFDKGALNSPGAEHWLIAPMIAIMGLTLGLILLAQGMDKVFNPRVRTRMAGESGDEVDPEEDSGSKAEVF